MTNALVLTVALAVSMALPLATATPQVKTEMTKPSKSQIAPSTSGTAKNQPSTLSKKPCRKICPQRDGTFDCAKDCPEVKQ